MGIHVFEYGDHDSDPAKNTVRGEYIDQMGDVWVVDIGGNRSFLRQDEYIRRGYQPDISTLPIK